jgi:microcystin-dependent protein
MSKFRKSRLKYYLLLAAASGILVSYLVQSWEVNLRNGTINLSGGVDANSVLNVSGAGAKIYAPRVCLAGSCTTAWDSSGANTGEVRLYAGSIEPVGWLFCNGSSLDPSAYPDLFAVIGTTYGGDGETSFNIPDFRGRVPVAVGQGEGLTDRDIGVSGGNESVTLSVGNLPAHNHSAHSTGSSTGNRDSPSGNVPGTLGASHIYSSNTSSHVNMSSTGANISAAGEGLPHNNMKPYAVLNYMIKT